MDDKKIKDMWQKAEFIIGNSKYDLSSIDGFISSSSKQVSEQISKLYQGSIIIKSILTLVLILDVFLYYNVQRNIANYCMVAIPFLIGLIIFENNLLNKFKNCTNNMQSIKSRLTNMQQFLKQNSFISLFSIAASYLFAFISLMLIYFFVEYGEFRRMGSLDIFVFPTICILGILFTFIFNGKIMKSQEQHLDICLSEIDIELLPFIKEKMELQQKNERMKSILIGIIIFLSFLVLVAILKAKGL